MICAKADDAELFLKWSVDAAVSACTVVGGPHTLCSHLSNRSGLVESKIRILVGKLEINEGIQLAHVYPTSFGPPTPERWLAWLS